MFRYMNNTLVSIIMPVYNGKEYIRKAIDSILKQTLSDWNLIIVDDGSKDGTAVILDNYANEDKRIIVFHRENHGVSASRQFGIDQAEGKYCAFVDADDWVESDFLSNLVTIAEKNDADMVWCDWYVNESDYWSHACEEAPDALIRSFLKQKTWGSLVNRITKTTLYQRKEVNFIPNCSMWEDMSFLVQCLCFCSNIKYVQKPLYHYRMNPQSLTHTQSQKDISAEYRKAIDYISDFFEQQGVASKYEYELRGLKLFAIRDFIDDVRFQDYDRFMNTYPDAIEHISEYPDYPNRLKFCAWLLRHKLSGLIPAVCKIDAGLRRIGLSKQV